MKKKHLNNMRKKPFLKIKNSPLELEKDFIKIRKNGNTEN